MKPLPHCASCRRPVRWVVSERGRMMPLDPAPCADGNVILVGTTPGGSEIGVVLRRDATPAPGIQRYMPHFATCPDAAKFRRKNAKTSG